MAFLRVCLERPYLDVFDIADDAPALLTPEQKKEELIAFTILFSVFERAYLTYCRHPQSSQSRQSQWPGWEAFIRTYARRSNFREAFLKSGNTFDERFEKYMNSLLAEYEQKAPTSPHHRACSP